MNEMQNKKLTAVFSHGLGWVILLSLPLLFLGQRAGSPSPGQILSSWNYWVFVLSLILMFYLHTYWLYPRLYVTKKYTLYAGSLVLMCFLVLYLKPFDQLITSNRDREMQGPPPELRPPLGLNSPERQQNGPHPPFGPPDGNGRFDVTSLFLFFLLVALGIAIQTILRLRETEKRALQAEADKANAELSFLKAQINPHFLFNTLNNIYSMAIADSEPTADAIMKLSNIMRYVTDEVTANLVPLESEATCIQDYIDLQQLRLSKQVQVEYTVEGNLRQKSVPPLVLMTFVENAFKFGVSNHEPANISIGLAAEEEIITFTCTNTLFETPRNVVSTGIGLENIKQRLKHIYPNRHQLNINQENGLFTIRLTLQT